MKELCLKKWPYENNLGICLMNRDHLRETGKGCCYTMVTHNPCHHKECDVAEQSNVRCFFVETHLNSSEETLSTLLFRPDHNRPRIGVALQFCGWELVLQADGTYYVNDTSGG